MLERFVICDHGRVEASLVPHRLLDRPGKCPYGIYDTFHVYQGDVLDWDDHWNRLDEGCKFLGVSAKPAAEAISRNAVLELVNSQNLRDESARLRIEIFAEPHTLEDGRQIGFLAAVWPVLPGENDPITVSLGKSIRQHGDKRYNYKLLGRSYIEEEVDAAAIRHCGDVIFLNNHEQLCEGSYSNVWLITGKQITTPPVTSPCLPGVTRSRILSVSPELGLNVDEMEITLQDVVKADGMFLTSSIRGVQPVGAVENFHIFPEMSEVLNVLTLLANSLRSA